MQTVEVEGQARVKGFKDGKLYSTHLSGRQKNPRSLIGIVEEVGIDEKRAFTNLDELWAILQSIKNWPEQSTKAAETLSLKNS